MSAWLRGFIDRLSPDEAALVNGLADLLDELELPGLDVEACEVSKDEIGLHIRLAHHDPARSVAVSEVGEIVVGYGVESEHFDQHDFETGARVGPFMGGDYREQALSFLRWLLTGRVELHVWERPVWVKTRSYWIDDDGVRHLFLTGGRTAALLGWSNDPDTQRFDFTQE